MTSHDRRGVALRRLVLAFVSITAIVFGVYTVQNAPDSNTADLWLAGNWFAWAVLWGMFFAPLTLDLPIARITGWVAIIDGIGTSAITCQVSA